MPSSDHVIEIPVSDPSGLDESHIIMEEEKENSSRQLGSMSSPITSAIESGSSSYIIVAVEDSLSLDDRVLDTDKLKETMESTFINSSARFANVDSSPVKPSSDGALNDFCPDEIIPEEHLSLEPSKINNSGGLNKHTEQDPVATGIKNSVQESIVHAESAGVKHNSPLQILQSQDLSKNAKIRVVAENIFEFDADSDSDLPTFEQLISSTQKRSNDNIEEQIRQKNKIKEELEDDPDALREALNSFHESFDGSADEENVASSPIMVQKRGPRKELERSQKPKKLVRKSEPASSSARSVIKQRSESLNLSRRQKTSQVDDFDSIPSTMPEKRHVSDNDRWRSVKTEHSASALIDLTELSDDSSKGPEVKVTAQPSFQSNEPDLPPPSSAPAFIGGFPSGHVPQFRKQTFKRKVQRGVSVDPAANQWRVISSSSDK